MSNLNDNLKPPPKVTISNQDDLKMPFPEIENKLWVEWESFKEQFENRLALVLDTYDRQMQIMQDRLDDAAK